MPRGKFTSTTDAGNIYCTEVRLKQEDIEWYRENANRVTENTGLMLNRRDSAINALRMFMLAGEIGQYDTYEEMDRAIREMSPEDIKANLGRMFALLEDDKRATKEDKAEYIGRVYRRAYDKVLEYKVPDLSNASVGDLQEYSDQIQGLGLLSTGSDQDVEPIRGSDADAGVKLAFEKGFGGKNEYAAITEKVAVYAKGITSIYDFLGLGFLSTGGTALAVNVLKDFYGRNAGKIIKDLSPREMIWGGVAVQTVGGSTDITAKAGQDYLDGKTPTLPGADAIIAKVEEITDSTIKKESDKLSEAAEILQRTPFDHLESLLGDIEDLENKDLLELPAGTKKALQRAYLDTFGKVFTEDVNKALIANGSDEFRAIRVGTKTIREYVDEKYGKLGGYTEAEREEAMALETVALLAKGKKPLSFTFRYPADGRESGGYTVRPEPDLFRFTVPASGKDGGLVYRASDAQAFLRDPDGEGRTPANLALRSPAYRNIFRGFLAAQKPLMDAEGMSFLDCVCIGDRTLRQLYEEKYKTLAPFDKLADVEALMQNVLVAECFAQPAEEAPKAYLIRLTDDGTGIRRSAVPISFEGSDFLKEVPAPTTNRTVLDDDLKQQRIEDIQTRVGKLPGGEQVNLVAKLILANRDNHKLLRPEEIEYLPRIPIDKYSMAEYLVNHMTPIERSHAEAALPDFLSDFRKSSCLGIDEDQLSKLENISRRAFRTNTMDTNAKLHHNSKEWNAFAKALEDLERFSRERTRDGKAGEDLSAAEQRKSADLMKRVEKAALEYLKDKGDRPRKTDQGMARYRLAMSAIRVCAPENANALLHDHNHRFPADKRTELSDLELMASPCRVDPIRELDAMLEAERNRFRTAQKDYDFDTTVYRISYLTAVRNLCNEGALRGSFEAAVKSATVTEKGSEYFTRMQDTPFQKLSREKKIELCRPGNELMLVSKVSTQLKPAEAAPARNAASPQAGRNPEAPAVGRRL